MADYIFTGTGTAIVTPFTSDDKIDYAAFNRHVDLQIDGGVECLVVLGTTGENATIWPKERREFVQAAIDYVDGRVPVIVGTGNNSTSESITFSTEAARQGADGLLIVGPYYNKPTQAGFKAHVKAIADATDCPLVLYNVPGRTSFNILPQTILELAEEVPTVVGIKEASGSIAQIGDLLAGRPDTLAVYSGDDEMTLPLIGLGGDGAVSVISNALPEPFSDMTRAALDGRMDDARRRHFKLLDAMRACFVETNPIPIKAVLADMGVMNGRLRLPLVDLTEENRPRVLEAFRPFT
ncbi:MAG: 4-hydroxy-tetrahydrodipicolinate synthase [Rhodothermales bacterium]